MIIAANLETRHLTSANQSVDSGRVEMEILSYFGSRHDPSGGGIAGLDCCCPPLCAENGFRSSFTISAKSASICNFSVGEAVRAFLISSIKYSRITISEGVGVTSASQLTANARLLFRV
jgi:hypothetical protein